MNAAAITDRHTEPFKAHIAESRSKWTALLETLVNMHCGSEMVDGVKAVTDIVAEHLRELGFTVSRIDGAPFAPHLLAELGNPERPIVLGGHLDTTYTDYAELPKFHVDGEHAIGPGTADMKGGIVVYLAAMDALSAAGLLGDLPLVVLLNSDEERGSATSRTALQRYAETASAALFTECGGPNGEFVTGRRAKLSYRLDVTGVVRHAGNELHEKASALTAMAHKIIAVEAFNGRFEGASFNVGRAFGGVASNTVPGTARGLIDIRYPGADQETPIRHAMETICAAVDVPRCTATLTETSYRPVWPQRAGGDSLVELVVQLAAALGMSEACEARGGTSDANWFGAAGADCIDGLGPIGFDDHTPKERIVLSTLFDRALLLALLLIALGETR